LEKLQRHSARFVKGDYRTTSSVSQMLHDLGWCDLKDRRRDLRLALLYKIVTVIVVVVVVVVLLLVVVVVVVVVEIRGYVSAVSYFADIRNSYRYG